MQAIMRNSINWFATLFARRNMDVLAGMVADWFIIFSHDMRRCLVAGYIARIIGKTFDPQRARKDTTTCGCIVRTDVHWRLRGMRIRQAFWMVRYARLDSGSSSRIIPPGIRSVHRGNA